MFLAVVASAALVSTPPAGTQSLAPAEPSAAQGGSQGASPGAPAQDPNRKVCKRVVSREQSGSRIGGGGRVCKTARQWEEIEAKKQKSSGSAA